MRARYCRAATDRYLAGAYLCSDPNRDCHLIMPLIIAVRVTWPVIRALRESTRRATATARAAAAAATAVAATRPTVDDSRDTIGERRGDRRWIARRNCSPVAAVCDRIIIAPLRNNNKYLRVTDTLRDHITHILASYHLSRSTFASPVFDQTNSLELSALIDKNCVVPERELCRRLRKAVKFLCS